MSKLEYKIGDRVKIKSLNWYNENKDEDGDVFCGEYDFVDLMTKFCGKIVTIENCYEHDCYAIKEDNESFVFTGEMFEGLAEENNDMEEETLIEKVDDNGLPFNEWLSHKGAFHVPDGYKLKDENGNVINAIKIVLEKKKEYPKTYEECCKVLGIDTRDLEILDNMLDTTEVIYRKNLDRLLNSFRKLLICRDVYWKLYGEEMGLNRPWDPTDSKVCYSIFTIAGEIQYHTTAKWRILAFPTEEMRDAFYEIFKELIEYCKELL